MFNFFILIITNLINNYFYAILYCTKLTYRILIIKETKRKKKERERENW